VRGRQVDRRGRGGAVRGAVVSASGRHAEVKPTFGIRRGALRGVGRLRPLDRDDQGRWTARAAGRFRASEGGTSRTRAMARRTGAGPPDGSRARRVRRRGNLDRERDGVGPSAHGAREPSRSETCGPGSVSRAVGAARRNQGLTRSTAPPSGGARSGRSDGGVAPVEPGELFGLLGPNGGREDDDVRSPRAHVCDVGRGPPSRASRLDPESRRRVGYLRRDTLFPAT